VFVRYSHTIRTTLLTVQKEGILKNIVLSEPARNNKTAVKSHTITAIIMVLFCILRCYDGRQSSWAFAGIAALLGLAPVIAEHILYRKNKEHRLIKHCLGIGFLVFYTFTLFTAVNNLVFAFIIPMLLVLSVYGDTRYLLGINLIATIENIVVIALGFNSGKFAFETADDAIIQIVIMLMVTVYSIFTTNTLNANAKSKLENLSKAQEESGHALDNISELSNTMQAGIANVYCELGKLNQAANATQEAMAQLSNGASDTADAVQNQILQTETILSKIGMVDSAAASISNSMSHTLDVLKEGHEEINHLVEQVDSTVANGANVAKELETLDTYISEMNSIVEMISDITSQTGLLALNASIEAARAGESGRGFAVVATEITKMSTQTDDATEKITEIIQNISAGISDVVSAIYAMIESINAEKQSTLNTSKSFKMIQNNTFAIRDNVHTLNNAISELKDANNVIVESIQTISAITEEVSAHASDTMSSEEENTNILKEISIKMEELINQISQ
jgi:methyl-accepting chemotaxis protein